MEKSWPIGVTIVAILMVITGIILLSGGIFAVSSSAILSQFVGPLVAVVIGVGVFTIALGGSLCHGMGLVQRQGLGMDNHCSKAVN